MRTFLNGILSFIGSESLTDEEYNSLPDDLTQAYNVANYEALKAVVQNRDSISGQLKKLKSFFVAKGVDLNGQTANRPASQTLIGMALD